LFFPYKGFLRHLCYSLEKKKKSNYKSDSSWDVSNKLTLLHLRKIDICPAKNVWIQQSILK
jgi:hypothetical protein